MTSLRQLLHLGELLNLLIVLRITASSVQHVSSDVIEYRILEQQPVNSLIGNVLIDSRLHLIYSAQSLVSFRFNVMSVTTVSGSSATVSDETRNCFVVDAVSGLLRTSKTLDRERLCRPMSAQCAVQLDITVTPVQFFRVIRVVVHIDDINDNSPTFDPSHVDLSVYELSTVGARFPLPVAVDGDCGPFSVQEYQLHSTSGSHPFRLLDLNATSAESDGELYLILAGRLDREVRSSYLLTLTARDGGIPARTGTLPISITIVDANDNPPVFDRSVYEVSLDEDTPVGTTVAKVTAFDADEGDNARLVYKMMTSRSGAVQLSSMSLPSAPGPFAIDSETGHVVLVAALDRESNAEHVMSVVAMDSPIHGPPLSGYSRLVVKVADVNDNVPSVTVHALTSDGIIQVNENAPVGSFVAHLSTTDLDEGANGRITCQLTAGVRDFQLIKLGETEYQLVASRQFDRETQDQYQAVVTCMVTTVTSDT
jgi:protocadherin delta 1